MGEVWKNNRREGFGLGLSIQHVYVTNKRQVCVFVWVPHLVSLRVCVFIVLALC